MWHFANAFTDGASIVVDFCRWAQPGLGAGGGPARGATQRARLDVAAGTVGFETFDDTVAEFPRLDDRLLGRRHRFFHTAGRDPDHTPMVPGAWNALQRFDVDTGSSVVRRGGAVCFGEAVFAPRVGSTDQDDGYVMTYAYDTTTLDTTFIILEAGDIAGEPVATLRPPHRVPFGLHGAFIPT